MKDVYNAIKLIAYYLFGGLIMMGLVEFVEHTFAITDPYDMQAIAFVGAIMIIFLVTWRASEDGIFD